MFDPEKSLNLIKGGLFDSEATWKGYLPEADDWQKTALLMTIPLIVVAAILGYAIGLFGSDVSFLGRRPTLMSTIVGILMSAVAAGVAALVVSTFAGMFDGRKSFALGLAATTFAFVPGYLGGALNWLPWIGSLVALGLFIYALVLLWRIIPIYLEVPDGKRVGHYIASLVTIVVAMMVLGLVLRPVLAPMMSDTTTFSRTNSADDGPSGFGGVIGQAMRQGELIAAAKEDRYDPPSNGKLKDSQVREVVRVVERAVEIMEEKGERIKELTERAENDGDLSMSEMSEMMRGATTMMGLNTIELEIVKSSGGNWAEYEWVKNSLQTAYIQKDSSEAVAHNYELYKKYENKLRPFISR